MYTHTYMYVYIIAIALVDTRQIVTAYRVLSITQGRALINFLDRILLLSLRRRPVKLCLRDRTATGLGELINVGAQTPLYR